MTKSLTRVEFYECMSDVTCTGSEKYHCGCIKEFYSLKPPVFVLLACAFKVCKYCKANGRSDEYKVYVEERLL